MRSDGIAQKCALKNGLVIINLQCTPYDDKSALRIYGNLQKVSEKLAAIMKIKVDTKTCIQNPYQWNKWYFVRYLLFRGSYINIMGII